MWRVAFKANCQVITECRSHTSCSTNADIKSWRMKDIRLFFFRECMIPFFVLIEAFDRVVKMPHRLSRSACARAHIVSSAKWHIKFPYIHEPHRSRQPRRPPKNNTTKRDIYSQTERVGRGSRPRDRMSENKSHNKRLICAPGFLELFSSLSRFVVFQHLART